MQLEVKASQRGQVGPDNQKSYHLWLEVSLNYHGRRGSWARQLDDPAEIPFNLQDVEGRFLFWLGFQLGVANDSWKKAARLGVGPAHATPQSLALAQEITDFLNQNP